MTRLAAILLLAICTAAPAYIALRYVMQAIERISL